MAKGPSYYQRGSSDVWDFIRDQGLNFHLGNAIKYICRAGYKDSKIQDLENELEELTDDEDSYEFTEEAKERYVEGRLDDVRYDPVAFLRDYGLEREIENFIDQESFIEDVIRSDGRGHTISSYDGSEDEVEYEGTTYYIYRMN